MCFQNNMGGKFGFLEKNCCALFFEFNDMMYLLFSKKLTNRF